MNERFAVALAIRDDSGRFAFGLRGEGEREYRNRWSLPSMSVTEEEYSQIVSGLVLPLTLFAGDRFARLGIEPPAATTFLRSCDRCRSGYQLSLALLGGYMRASFGPSRKYKTLEWFSIDEALNQMRNEVGSCVSLLLEDLYETRVADYSQRAVEVPPELADAGRDLESYSQAELWKTCAANYDVLIRGGSGGDGHLKRRFALEPAIARFVRSLPVGSRVADLGCGDGELVQRLRAAGHEATGIDITPAVQTLKLGADIVRRGNIEHLSTYYESESLDIAILSLVCQWLSDVNSVASDLARVVVPWGRVVVILVAPEFAKAGDWDFTSSPPHFVLNRPYRRAPFLTMINRGVGPLWYYPRSIPEYLTVFGAAGFACARAEYLYLDSFESRGAVTDLLAERPYLMQNVMVPCFLWLDFLRLPERQRVASAT